MKPIERRLRALEALADFKPPKPVRSIIVHVGETLEEVLECEGIVCSPGPEIDVIARISVEPKVIETDQALSVGNGLDKDLPYAGLAPRNLVDVVTRRRRR